jgi:pre-rRNA-processing protein IPI1
MKYAHMIMPLMFETWMESRPSTENKNNSNFSSLTGESALLLKLIMDIMIELFQMIEKNENSRQNFLKKYQDSFDKYLATNFPYTQNVDVSRKTSETGGEKCLYQNLSISIMYLHFALKNQQRFLKYREKFCAFIEDCIVNWKSAKDQQFSSMMKKIIQILFATDLKKILPSETKKIFFELVKKCDVDQSNYDPKLALVCEIIEDGGKCDSIYDNLLTHMINVLADNKFIPVHLIKTISILARRGNQSIHNAITARAMDIYKNLNKIKFSGDLSSTDLRWKMEIANLFYWITDAKVLEEVNESTDDNKINDFLLMNVKDIVRMKLNL